MKYSLTFWALIICMSACKQGEKNVEAGHPKQVGDLFFNPKTDKAGYQPCHADLVYQYYNFSNGLQFKGEKPAIDRYFKENFKATEAEHEDGYITIRFIVNCEGKACWFRVEEMDLDYQPKHFSKAISNQLLELTKELEGWEIAEYEEEKYDYYQYLSFGILNGQLTEILP